MVESKTTRGGDKDDAIDGLLDVLQDVIDKFPNFEFSTKERDALYLKIKKAMKEAESVGYN